MQRLLGLLAVATVACSSAPESPAEVEDEAEVASDVVVADRRVTAAAVVLADRVTIPGALPELKPGVVFVGARGPKGSKNPDGFLRRITAVHRSGGEMVVETTPAGLTDAVVRGAVRASSGGVRFDSEGEGRALPSKASFAGVSIDFADRALFENVAEVVSQGRVVRVTESIVLEKAVLVAQPTVSVDLAIADGKVRRFAANVSGNLDTQVRAVVRVKADGPLDANARAQLLEQRHDVRRVVYQSPRVPLPTFSVGRVPVSPSVAFTVELHCAFSFGGPLEATAGVAATSFVRLGASYDGAWREPSRSEFDIVPSFDLTEPGEVDARCAIEAHAELGAYGVGGVTMSVAPYVSFSVRPGGPGVFDYRADAGATGAMKGRADVFGVRPEELARNLVEWTAPDPLRGTVRLHGRLADQRRLR